MTEHLSLRIHSVAGEQHLENDEVTLKEMDSGDQVAVPVDSFPGEHDAPTFEDFE